HNYLKTSLVDPSYPTLAGVYDPAIGVKALSPVNTQGITYGLANSCANASDVLMPESGGLPSSLYTPAGLATPPVVAGVIHEVNSGTGEFWRSLVDGFDFSNLIASTSYPVYPRLTYLNDVGTNVFGAGCTFIYPIICLCGDVPNT